MGGLRRFDSLRETDSGSAVGVVAQEPSPWMAPRCRAILHKARWGEQFVISDQKKVVMVQSTVTKDGQAPACELCLIAVRQEQQRGLSEACVYSGGPLGTATGGTSATVQTKGWLMGDGWSARRRRASARRWGSSGTAGWVGCLHVRAGRERIADEALAGRRNRLGVF